MFAAGVANDAEGAKVKEAAVTALAKLLAKLKDAPALRALLTELRPLFATLPKAKTAKIVRTVLDVVATMPDSIALQLELCKEQLEWARQEKRTFLRHRVECRLAALYLETKEYPAALALIGSLLTEVKRLDDKLLLVDIHLLESRAHHALRNMPKAKAALTAGRTAANAIYVPPNVQAAIDEQSGTLHAEEKDYKTAFSYFFEAFEQLNNLESPTAVLPLKYMLLCKVMSKQAEDVSTIISAKAGLKYEGLELEAMKAVADAYLKRNLKMLEETLQQYKAQLGSDSIISVHLASLQSSLLEQNLCRLIEPYSRVEIAHIAKLIDLDVSTVERKLSQMILDKKFKGILDQGNGCLIVFEETPPDVVYTPALETVKGMDRVVDSLMQKSSRIVAA